MGILNSDGVDVKNFRVILFFVLILAATYNLQGEYLAKYDDEKTGEIKECCVDEVIIRSPIDGSCECVNSTLLANYRIDNPSLNKMPCHRPLNSKKQGCICPEQKPEEKAEKL